MKITLSFYWNITYIQVFSISYSICCLKNSIAQGKQDKYTKNNRIILGNMFFLITLQKVEACKVMWVPLGDINLFNS